MSRFLTQLAFNLASSGVLKVCTSRLGWALETASFPSMSSPALIVIQLTTHTHAQVLVSAYKMALSHKTTKTFFLYLIISALITH